MKEHRLYRVSIEQGHAHERHFVAWVRRGRCWVGCGNGPTPAAALQVALAEVRFRRRAGALGAYMVQLFDDGTLHYIRAGMDKSEADAHAVHLRDLHLGCKVEVVHSLEA